MSRNDTHEYWVPIGDNPDNVLPEKITCVGPLVDRTLKPVQFSPNIDRSTKPLTDELLDFRDEQLALQLSQLKI